MEYEKLRFSSPVLRLNYIDFTVLPDKKYRDIHMHKEVEIIRVEKGAVKCHVDNHILTIMPGQILFINSRTLHKIVPCTADISMCTYFQIDADSYIRRFLPKEQSTFHIVLNMDSSIPYALYDNKSELYEIYEDMKSEYDKKDLCFEDYIRADIFRIIAFMRRNKLCAISDDMKQISKIELALIYADKNYSRKISLDEISGIMNMDKFYFCRKFKKISGMSFVEYLNNLRIYYVEEKLLSTNMTISEIAFSCGFDSIQHFNRVFKKNKNYSPKEYRKILDNCWT